MANSDNSLLTTLRLKTDKYKGETYYSLVGSIEVGNQRVGVSIATDSDGNPKIYVNQEKNRPYVYARFFKTSKDFKKKRSL